MVDEEQASGAGLSGQAHGVVDGGMTHERLGRELGGGVLGVVDEQVDIASE